MRDAQARDLAKGNLPIARVIDLIDRVGCLYCCCGTPAGRPPKAPAGGRAVRRTYIADGLWLLLVGALKKLSPAAGQPGKRVLDQLKKDYALVANTDRI
jgi:hypothetical protein